jgi:DNA polymerase-3 subunit epsilon
MTAEVIRSTMPVQASFDDLGTPLSEVTFVVVDLETTGGSPAAGHGITEIGAVKVRGGVVLGELQTLVDPGEPIPPFIAVLTGITDAMVAGSPRIGAVLPQFLEFAHGCVLVAHNAPFDVGFLRAAAEQHGVAWPRFGVVDTAQLARRVVTRDEAPNCKLGTLARVFHASTTPTHRALDDARATVDVLHGLLERVGPLGVQSWEDLRGFSGRVAESTRRKRHLADALPDAAGVYLFKDARGEVLYVGKSTSLRRRVRSYFTASEKRSRMAEMVGIAEQVTPVVCATPLEAEVRELRLIAEHKPRYNRRSRNPERTWWIKLTVEPFPRLSLVREVRADAADTLYVGPLGSRHTAESVRDLLHDVFPVRPCTLRLSPRRPTSACVLAELSRCGAPCDGSEDVASYAVHVDGVRDALLGDPSSIVDHTVQRLDALAESERYEEAAIARDRAASYLRTVERWQRMRALAALPELVAGRRAEAGGWDLAVVRHGRLAAAAHAAPGTDPRSVAEAARATAETVTPGHAPLTAASPEETGCVLRWLETPGTRLVSVDGDWASPVRGAGAYRSWVERSSAAPAAADPAADRRGLRPQHRPAR